MEELKIVYLPIDDLHPYEKNARRHQKKDVDVIKESIEKFGFNDPIGIWSDKNIVVEGHGRLEAVKQLGWLTVPCIRLDHLTDDQRKAYALAHNRSAELSTWDFDTLDSELAELRDEFDFDALGFSDIMKEEDFSESDLEEDNYDVSLPEEEITQPGDLYELNGHRLLCGDSTLHEDVDKLVEGREVDLFYTDPPYNVNVSNSEGDTIENDNLPAEQFRQLLMSAFENGSRCLKEGGAFYVWHGDSERVAFQQCLEENGLIVKQCLIWVKNGFNFGRQDYKWQHEPCLYGWREGEAHYFIAEFNHPTVFEDNLDLDAMKKEDLKDLCKKLLEVTIPTTVIHENKPIKNDLHPTMKPLTICGQMIRNSSRKNQVVLDLFGGSGSTMIACEQLGRKCYMMELDPKYCDVIVKRYLKYMGSSEGCLLNGKPLPDKFKTSLFD